MDNKNYKNYQNVYCSSEGCIFRTNNELETLANKEIMDKILNDMDKEKDRKDRLEKDK